MNRFQALDGIRGLFAVAVVVHHSHILQSVTEWAFFKNANYLVEFFFALSGFLLYRRYTQSLVSGQKLRQFMIARTCRVYPLHVFMLLVFIGFECLKLLLERRGITLNTLSFSGDRAIGEIAPNILLLQAWWPGANALSFNYPSWIVSVEYYIYLLFGLLALMLPRYSTAVFATIAALALLALYFGSTPLPDNVLRGLGCFFAGGVTYWLYARVNHLRLGMLAGSVLEVGVVGAIYLVMTGSQTPQDAMLAILFCVAVGVFAFEAGSLSTVFKNRLFVWLGERWFSIYMTHAAVIFVSTIAVTLAAKITGLPLMVDVPGDVAGITTRYISTGSLLSDNLLVVGEMIVVLGISALTHRYIERPGIGLGKRWNRVRSGDGPLRRNLPE